MNTKEKFLLQLSKNNLKKYEFGLIDDIFRDIDNLDWSNKLQSVYEKYAEARDFGDRILNESAATYRELKEQLDFLENALNELGVEPMGSVAEAKEKLRTIESQIDGLEDDLNSGVLA